MALITYISTNSEIKDKAAGPSLSIQDTKGQVFNSYFMEVSGVSLKYSTLSTYQDATNFTNETYFCSLLY